MKALIINCTLKPSPEFSNTDALVQKAVAQFHDLGVDTEVIRLLDYDVKFGTEKDMGDGDQWPLILQKIKDCNIFIIATPIWMGHIASTTQQVIERLDAIFHDEELSDPDNGQFFPYNKVAGCLITGNEDGAHACAAQILWAMQESGFTIPPNVNAYWTGMAGAGKDYVEAGGEQWWFTNYTLRYMTSNLAWLAKLLQDNPIPTDLKALKELAKAESPR